MKVSENDLIADICRKSFPDFCRHAWPIIIPETMIWNWHMQYMAEQMQTVAERVFASQPKKYDLVKNVPPGSSKSSIDSIMFPAWVWTRMPTARICGASYADPLALDLSQKCRDLIESDWYRTLFPKVKLRQDQNTKHNFKNTKGGFRYAVGSGGSVLGMHFHFIIIDDPIDPQAAISTIEMDTTNHWIDRVLGQRKVDSQISVIILVMQRLHQEDPSARMLYRSEEGKSNLTKVKHICIPASSDYEVKPKALKKYYIDGLMDPVRFPKVVLEEKKLKLGEYGFSGQFGQKPVPLGGGMFKTDRIKIEPRAPERFKQIVRYWDKAATEQTKGAAFTVGAKMGLDFEDKIWVLDVQRFQHDSAKREKIMLWTAEQDGQGVHIGTEQEPGSGGKESAENTAIRLGLAGFNCQIFKVTVDKVIRADPYSVQVNNGNVYMVKAAWNNSYLDELKNFPLARLKDQVDASTGAFTMLTAARPRCGGMVGKRPDMGLWSMERDTKNTKK